MAYLIAAVDREYFIDRDGEKFVAVLEYLRGNSRVYIDPLEASFFALPLPSLPFHQLVQKDIALARKIFLGYQPEILADLVAYYTVSKPGARFGVESVSWDVCDDWSQRSRQYTNLPRGYKRALLYSFLPGEPSFCALLSEAKSFFLPQGLECSISQDKSRIGSPWQFTFSWNSAPKDSSSNIEEILRKCTVWGDRFRIHS
jgi:hypothetical protein